MKDITIVTAYFDIGRGDFTSNYARGNNKYINYFKFWARIKNNLIIYTQKEFKEEIEEIRKSLNLEDKTQIIVIDDIYALYPEMYKKMQKIENDEYYKNFRYLKYNPDNMAKYDYIMFLKTYCMLDASKKTDSEFLAWFDFGFNHGGDFYTNEKDFEMLWEYPFEDKIYLSALKEDDGKPIFDIIQNSEVYIQGCPYMLPRKLMPEFYDLMYNALNEMIDLGFIDDDQTLLLMAYRKKPEIFKVDIYDWFQILNKYTSNEMQMAPKKEIKPKAKDKLLNKYRIRKRNKIYLKGIKKSFLKDYLD